MRTCLPRVSEVYVRRFPGNVIHYVFVALFTDQGPAQERFPVGRVIRVQAPLELLDEMRIPNTQARSLLDDNEAQLYRELDEKGVSCRYVGRTNGEGCRETLFQLEDVSAFDAIANAWLARQTWPTQIRDDPDWRFYKSALAPDEHALDQIAATKLYEKLESQGRDLKKRHNIDFYFYGEAERLAQLQAVLLKNKLEVKRLKSGGLTVRRHFIIRPLDIADQAIAFRKLAQRYGVEFDGWEIELGK